MNPQKKDFTILTNKIAFLFTKLGPVFALFIVIAIFGSLRPDLFFTFRNFSNVAGQTVVIAVAAIGMTFIIVSAGIDLSVGSLVALSGVYATMVMSTDYFAMGIFLGILAGIATGALCGFLNGLLITKGKLAPFIVTLGMMEIIRGVALHSAGGLPVTNIPDNFNKLGNAIMPITISKSYEFSPDEIKFRNLTIRIKEGNDAVSLHIRDTLSPETLELLEQHRGFNEPDPELKKNLLQALNNYIKDGLIYDEERFSHVQLSDRMIERIQNPPDGKELIYLNRLLLEKAFPKLIDKGDITMLLPYSLFILIPLGLIAGFILKYTVFGIQVYAVGSNEQTARLCGVNVDKVKIFVYLLGGITAGIAGILHASRLNTGQPSEAIGMELEVIAAVVIGGGSLMGGEGTILGSVVGAFIIKFLRNGCNLIGVSSFVQRIVIGIIIIVAVYIDQLRRKALEKKTGEGH